MGAEGACTAHRGTVQVECASAYRLRHCLWPLLRVYEFLLILSSVVGLPFFSCPMPVRHGRRSSFRITFEKKSSFLRCRLNERAQSVEAEIFVK